MQQIFQEYLQIKKLKSLIFMLSYNWRFKMMDRKEEQI